MKYLVYSFLILVSGAASVEAREISEGEKATRAVSSSGKAHLKIQQGLKVFKKVKLVKEGKSINSKDADFGYFFNAVEDKLKDKNLKKLFRLKKNRSYALEIDVLEKNEANSNSKDSNQEAFDKYVLQLSVFDLKSKNKVAETSMDCCKKSFNKK